jgi:beta-N-acetylglucosaminidase
MPFRKISALLMAAFALSAAAPRLCAQTRWVVTSTGKMDPRITAELEHAARARHAALKFVQANPASPPPREPRGVLSIELVQAADLAAFAKNLTPPGADSAEVPEALARGGYILAARAVSPLRLREISLTAATAEGFHNALLRLPQLLHPRAIERPSALYPAPQAFSVERQGKTLGLTLWDYPSFAERGIVEGFYGKPWSHSERLDMLRFEGAHRMNVYYYAPKDDPYHRKLWDRPYPAARLKQLGELVEAAHENFVDFCFAVSPGLSMTYSSDEDFQKLAEKLDSVSKLGVTCFALFLDDVPQQLENPADLARYKTLAAAHVDIINRVHRYLKSQSAENRLVVTPTVYTSLWGSREYARELGAGVDPDVPIVWTGPQVASPEITAAEANEWAALIRRKPLVWDNFPVNDYDPWRLNLGPMRGRGPDLAAAVQGLFSNPMNQAEASKIPLQTIAEYLWNAEKYDPDAAYERALRDQYGPYGRRHLKAFLETYGDYGWDENIFQPLFTERRSTFDVTLMRRRAALLKRAIYPLRRVRRYRTLALELAPFPVNVQKRIPKVLADPAFEHLAGGKLRLRESYDSLEARQMTAPPKLDGDFSKWQGGKVYTLDSPDQITSGRWRWKGASQFSARYALGWDESHLYLGVEVTNSELYQPFRGRDIAKGDLVSIMLETAFQKNLLASHAGVDEYDLLFSPGNFGDVAADVYSAQDYLPPRPVPRDYEKEIQTAWRKTANGYSGDIVLPASWFEGGKFKEGYRVGLVVSAQKAFPPPAGTPSDQQTIVRRIVFRSKEDGVFPARFGNPQSYQMLVLKGPGRGN